MRSAVLGAFAIVLEFFGYIGLALYTYERSTIMGMMMFVCGAFFCIVAAAYHVKTAMAEYIFLKLERDNRGKDLMLELMQTGTILRVCILGLLVYIGVLIAAIVTGTIGFPVWAVLFTILPIFVLLFPLKIVGTMHIAAMVSMLAWILFI